MSNDSKVTTLDTPSASTAAAVKASASKTLPGKSAGHDTALSGKTLELNIYASDQEHGSNAVEIGLNGVMYLVPRGEYFTVPMELVAVLRNAVVTVTSPAKTGGGVVEREVPRYNFQVR
jgi:hypothetical protein